MTTLADVTAALDALYPPALAESWDAVGLVCGDPFAPVRRVLLAVDPTPEVAAEAVAGGYDLLLTHHPLFLGGTTSVAADDPKGRVVHDLVRAGCGLFVAHTNADRAVGGVNDALAALFDLRDTEPLERVPEPVDKLIVFVPVPHAEKVRQAIAEAGAGRLGAYDSCSWSTQGEGAFRPLPGAEPAIGEVGALEHVAETRVETVVPRGLREQVLAAMRAAHPYETPAYDVVPVADLPGDTGLGRVGALPEPLTLAALVERVAQVLPATAWGVRGAGDPTAVVSRLAVCGGSGADAIEAAATSGAQAYLTSDLKHHRVSERPPGLALIDAAHWATEQPWLATAAAALARVVQVDTVVSTLRTDPWTTASRSPHA
ncbi:MAG TPA: Nif3-like dinuclear metal center hexameric protein [Mycobacteriales bacterium]|nr:Nif3-like dinuclear metal center hexameric protein [Mycobacteriales bacterium]